MSFWRRKKFESDMEVELAISLREKGYGVWQG